jgi:hypothetical protein
MIDFKKLLYQNKENTAMVLHLHFFCLNLQQYCINKILKT